jgi:hypothetical protein
VKNKISISDDFISDNIRKSNDDISHYLDDYENGYKLIIPGRVSEIRLGPDDMTRELSMKQLMSSLRLNIKLRMLDIREKYCIREK